jgi:Fe-S cluster biogenesis protein NfuA
MSKLFSIENNVHSLVDVTFNWHHNGTNCNGEFILRIDGSCVGCGGEGNWREVDEFTIFAKFHGIEHVIKFNDTLTEGIVTTPVRDPQTRLSRKVNNEKNVHSLVDVSLNWLHDGTNCNGEFILRVDGSCVGCGGEGYWNKLDNLTIYAHFHGIGHVIKFNDTLTEGIVVAPERDPQTRISRKVNDEKKNGHSLVDVWFHWLHDGKNPNGEFVIRGDGSCFGCAGAGNWHEVNELTIFAKFHGIEHVIEFDSTLTEGIVTTPVRDPQTRLLRKIY